MKVFVVTGNDYPVYVFDNKAAADECATIGNAAAVGKGRKRTHWVVWVFNLLTESPK